MKFYKLSAYIHLIPFLIIVILCCISCSDESEIELYLQKNELQQIPINDANISCTVGQTNEILIFGGVGNYDVFSSNENILYPQVTGNFLNVIPRSVGKVSVTVMDDAHNSQEVTIFVEPSVRKFFISDISYEIEGGDTECQEAVKSELMASETLYKAYLSFEFNECEAGYLNLLLNSGQEEILIENIPFVWETTSKRISISFPNNMLLLDSGIESACEGKEGYWKTDLTEKFKQLYPDVLSVKKTLHYKLCE